MSTHRAFNRLHPAPWQHEEERILALARGIVEAMGGRIQVKSELGQGAEFTVKLPRVST